MPVHGLFDDLPLWGLFVATVVLVLVAGETGYLLGGHKRRRSEEAQKVPMAGIVAAMLGLLALILAFTFSSAASRFDTRKNLVLEEANAIGTTWLRAGLLPDPHRTTIRKLLHDYLETRLEAILARGNVQQAVARSEQLQSELWKETVAVSDKSPGSIVVGLFIASLNEVIDLHSKRVAAGLRNRIPAVIWVALYFVATLSIGAIGYHIGVLGVRRSFAVLPLVLAFSAVLLLIADLDRPQEGLLKVSQQALADLLQRMTEPEFGNTITPEMK